MTELMIATKRGRPQPATITTLPADMRREIEHRVMIANARLDLRARMGHDTTYNGRRNVSEAVGYPHDISAHDYARRYERQDIAQRIVRAKPNDTWRKVPVIKDGTNEEDATEDTPFAEAWQSIVNIGEAIDHTMLLDQRTIWHYCKRVDVAAGLGEFAPLLVGIDDGSDLAQPLSKGEGRTLLYLTPYAQTHARIDDGDLNKNPTSPRFNLPEYYRIRTDTAGTDGTEHRVHWSRVVHVADGLLSSDLYGTPRLRAVWNRLLDLEKVLAASGEAAWRMVTRKYFLTSEKDYAYTAEDEAEYTENVERMLHDLRDHIFMDGFKPTIVDGQVVEPEQLIASIIDMISAATEIPQRILMGSERGELASSQDRNNWFDAISTRQKEFAEPMILRPLIGRLIYAGVLPPPTRGVYIEWPSLYEEDELGTAQVAQTLAQAFATLTADGIDRMFSMEKLLPALFEQVPNEAIISDADRQRLADEAFARAQEMARARGPQNEERPQDDEDDEPVANAYRPMEAAAMLEAAHRILSTGA